MTNIPVRMGYCLECGHEAFQHQISMNTPQNGHCFQPECKCLCLDSPNREALGDELDAKAAKLRAEAEGI